ncbi:hypothetical protein KXV74_007870 [Aspergillus fumigatus]|nr:hypothetical protein KXW47_006059 [Aspergillus fumigatus]KAH2037080.1 hypothetical protein KXW51_003888 [Aspergillus fumigatus]KAH2164348.1 hypothetical protein KXV74_007870 [Aspergillus fumigatus]
MDLEAAAQRMTGWPDMQFRGVQDPAMRAIQWGESPVVAVMPTGGGKSMLFMVPAFAAPGGTTIVIVLLVESWQPPDAASIVLVMPESATSRPNVAYWVWRPPIPRVGRGPYQWIESKAVVIFIQDRIRRAAGGKVIIYANIIGQVTAMARVLGCEAYYSEQLDKAGVLVQFMGVSPVITATSVLGMGVDIPNIRSIIHIGTPWMLLDYA